MTTISSPQRSFRSRLFTTLLVSSAALASSCGQAQEAAKTTRPNIIWIVWDTTRADHMSLYGYQRETTPFLKEWAKGARVFDQCSSAACSTVPSHASMFTGKLPTEHGTCFGNQWLAEKNETLAEILQSDGYQTYLWASNPHVSSAENYAQGFQTEEHPWDEANRDQALRIVLRKLRRDHSSELGENIRKGGTNEWMIKAAGQLAQPGLTNWLEKRDKSRPYFAFINLMEAHRPFLPPARYRKRMMSNEEVDQSFNVDRSWVPMWAYSFGLHEYTQQELEIMAATYDSCLAELDDLFKSLIEQLTANGELENTVILLTADHGEQLGEHHMLDHQYSLYESLTHVPLVVYAPGRLAAGRDEHPVANFDIFPTLLEIAGIDPAKGPQSTAVSLLHPSADRPLLSELPATFTEPFVAVGRNYPDFDPVPWTRKLKALRYKGHKLIWSSAGDHELYDLRADPKELHNLILSRPKLASEMMGELKSFLETLHKPMASEEGGRREFSPEYLQMLKDLGYAAGNDEDHNAMKAK